MLVNYLTSNHQKLQVFIRRDNIVLVVVRRHNDKNGKEASEETEGKSSRMRWGRKTEYKGNIEEEKRTVE